MSAPASKIPPLRLVSAEGARAPSDSEVLLAVKRGERWAGQALYDRAAPVVERALRRVLPTAGASDLEDLIQKTFERMLRALHAGHLAEVASLPAWATSAAGFVALDAVRQRVRERARLRLDPHSGERAAPGCTEQLAECNRALERLYGILSRMKPAQAHTLLLHDALGHDLAEIAELTGTTVAAAQSRLVRARADLARRSRGALPRGNT